MVANKRFHQNQSYDLNTEERPIGKPHLEGVDRL